MAWQSRRYRHSGCTCLIMRSAVSGPQPLRRWPAPRGGTGRMQSMWRGHLGTTSTMTVSRPSCQVRSGRRSRSSDDQARLGNRPKTRTSLLAPAADHRLPRRPPREQKRLCTPRSQSLRRPARRGACVGIESCPAGCGRPVHRKVRFGPLHDAFRPAPRYEWREHVISTLPWLGDHGCYRGLTMDKKGAKGFAASPEHARPERSVSPPASGQSNHLALKSQPQFAKNRNGREASVALTRLG